MKNDIILHLTPKANCQLCPRLFEFRQQNKKKYPDWHNLVVPNFVGIDDILLLIIGLAPGLKGANRTGRPFTGDYAGKILYKSLKENQLAKGDFSENGMDNFQLLNTTITNCVRCVPPQNKPTNIETKNCSQFLLKTIQNYTKLTHILCLGAIAHKAFISCCGLKQSEYKFIHAKKYHIKTNKLNINLYSSYHTSRYNIQTGRLSYEMFNDVVARITTELQLN